MNKINIPPRTIRNNIYANQNDSDNIPLIKEIKEGEM